MTVGLIMGSGLSKSPGLTMTVAVAAGISLLLGIAAYVAERRFKRESLPGK